MQPGFKKTQFQQKYLKDKTAWLNNVAPKSCRLILKTSSANCSISSYDNCGSVREGLCVPKQCRLAFLLVSHQN